MKYKEIVQNGVGLTTDSYFVHSEYVDGRTNIIVRDRRDYSLLLNITFEVELFLFAIIDQCAILYNYTKSGYYSLDLTSSHFTYINSDLIPEYKWTPSVTLFLDRRKNIYKCVQENGDLLFEFKPMFPVVDRWHKSGIIQFVNNQKSNNWIRCVDVTHGTEKWKLDYPWQIVRCDAHEHLLILDYHAFENIRQDEGYVGQRHWSNPNKYLIVIDAEKGEEVWRKQVSYSKLDEKYEVVLGERDDNIFVFDLGSGATIATVKVTPKDSMGYEYHFVDNDNIYYTRHSGSFGKIRKNDGFVEWEFDFVDENRNKRKLTDFILLGNGNLLLNTMSAGLNTSLICIFNPEENLEFSIVKDGIRIY